MKILTYLTTNTFFIIFLLSSLNLSAQEQKLKLNQDPRFEQLLSEKRKINSSITLHDRFKIQIFTGDAESSKKTLTDFRKKQQKHRRYYCVSHSYI